MHFKSPLTTSSLLLISTLTSAFVPDHLHPRYNPASAAHGKLAKDDFGSYAVHPQAVQHKPHVGHAAQRHGHGASHQGHGASHHPGHGKYHISPSAPGSEQGADPQQPNPGAEPHESPQGPPQPPPGVDASAQKHGSLSGGPPLQARFSYRAHKKPMPPLRALKEGRDMLEARLEALEARAAEPYAIADPEADPDASFDSVLGDIDKVTGTVGKIAGTATKIGGGLFKSFLGRREVEEAALMELYARAAAADAEAVADPDASFDSVLGDINKVTGTVGKVAGVATDIGGGLLKSFLRRGVDDTALMELYARAAAADAEAEANKFSDALGKGAHKVGDFVGEHKEGISTALSIGQQLMDAGSQSDPKVSAREALALAEAEAESMADPDAWMDEYELDF